MKPLRPEIAFGLRPESPIGLLMRKSEYLRRHLPLSGHVLVVFQSILDPRTSDPFLELYRQGATFHDVGKRVALDFLEKPSFTQQEREIMRLHPEAGRAFYDGLYGRQAKHHPHTFMAEHHHERWDGLGYPNGLKGEEIPHFGRLMALADVYSTVTQKRPYNGDVFTLAGGLDVLKADSGKAFDPEMTGKIIDGMEKLLNNPDVEGRPKVFQKSFDYVMRSQDQ